MCLHFLDNVFGIFKYEPLYKESNNSVYYKVPSGFYGGGSGKVYLRQEDLLIIMYILLKLQELKPKTREEVFEYLVVEGEMQIAEGEPSVDRIPGSRDSSISTETVTVSRSDPLTLIGATGGSCRPFRETTNLEIPKVILLGTLGGRVDPFRNMDRDNVRKNILSTLPFLRKRKGNRDKISIAGMFPAKRACFDRRKAVCFLPPTTKPNGAMCSIWSSSEFRKRVVAQGGIRTLTPWALPSSFIERHGGATDSSAPSPWWVPRKYCKEYPYNFSDNIVVGLKNQMDKSSGWMNPVNPEFIYGPSHRQGTW
jgi:hypothetical protein